MHAHVGGGRVSGPCTHLLRAHAMGEGEKQATGGEWGLLRNCTCRGVHCAQVVIRPDDKLFVAPPANNPLEVPAPAALDALLPVAAPAAGAGGAGGAGAGGALPPPPPPPPPAPRGRPLVRVAAPLGAGHMRPKVRGTKNRTTSTKKAPKARGPKKAPKARGRKQPAAELAVPAIAITVAAVLATVGEAPAQRAPVVLPGLEDVDASDDDVPMFLDTVSVGSCAGSVGIADASGGGDDITDDNGSVGSWDAEGNPTSSKTSSGGSEAPNMHAIALTGGSAPAHPAYKTMAELAASPTLSAYGVGCKRRAPDTVTAPPALVDGLATDSDDDSLAIVSGSAPLIKRARLGEL
jgi:hypothetical protein